MTDGACSDDEILSMELVVLKELNWGLSPMTPNSWMKMFLQVSNMDSRGEGSSTAAAFVTPQYSGLPFCRVMQLVDLCVLDINSLSFNYSVMAAAALAVVQGDRALATAVSGYAWHQLAECADWMQSFYDTLREESEVALVPRTFHNVQLENAHNIQTHSTEVRVLDAALDRYARLRRLREAERSRLSPDPTAHQVIAITPPEGAADARMAAASNYRKQHKTPQQQMASASSSSVFLSPESPEFAAAVVSLTAQQQQQQNYTNLLK